MVKIGIFANLRNFLLAAETGFPFTAPLVISALKRALYLAGAGTDCAFSGEIINAAKNKNNAEIFKNNLFRKQKFYSVYFYTG